MRPAPRRHAVLFALALVVPCLILLALGARMIADGAELARARQAEVNSRRLAQVGDELLSRLERIKLEEAGRQAASAPVGAMAAPDHPDIALVGWIREGRLLLPWDVDPARAAFRALLYGTRYGEVIARGERHEARQQSGLAEQTYADALALAPDRAAADYARLLRARALVKCRCPDDARPIYAALLESAAVDDEGVPLAFYAARQLLSLGGAESQVLAMLAARRVTPSSSPTAAHFAAELLATLAEPPSPVEVRREAETLRSRLAEPLADIERAVALQRDWMGLATSVTSGGGRPVWLPYDNGVWLVSTAPALAGLPPMVIALRAESVLAPIARPTADAPAVAFSWRAGDPVGPAFPGLRVALAAGAGQEALAEWTTQRTFYIVALLAVMGVALIGGAIFWWDVRRELRTADLRAQFVASVSHELRTPLTAIRMFAETLQMERPLDAADRAEYLETIVNESERLTRLVNNVLDFSRMERGEKVYHLEPASLPVVARDVARAMRYPLARQGFELAMQVDEDVPPVRVDRDAIEQAVLNLLSNAMKYSGEARQIALTVGRANGHVVLAVRDHGIGIHEADRARIFERFYRAPAPENDRIPGTGLGLALVDHIVKAHGGRVEVTTAPGAGSTFAIHLPQEATAR